MSEKEQIRIVEKERAYVEALARVDGEVGRKHKGRRGSGRKSEGSRTQTGIRPQTSKGKNSVQPSPKKHSRKKLIMKIGEKTLSI